MPRRKRVSKRRRELSLSEILDEVLPPSSLVRRGPDEVGEPTGDVDFDGRYDRLLDHKERAGGASTPRPRQQEVGPDA